MNPTRRRGFSIVELVLAALASCLLTTLAVPAIQNARDQARKGSCQSKLRQIGIALANYHDAHQMFPATYYAPYTDPGTRTEPWVGWQVSLLPYVGQEKMYGDIMKSPTLPAWPGGSFASPRLYRCPADLSIPTNGAQQALAPDTSLEGRGKSNYSACVGGDPMPRWFAGSMESGWPGAVANTEQLATRFPGVMHPNSDNGFKDCTDGTSTTILVVERSTLSTAGIWMGVRSLIFDNDVATDLSHLSRVNRSLSGASSMHKDGLFVLFADGSAKFLSQDTDSSIQGGVLQALAGRRDGQLVDDGAF